MRPTHSSPTPLGLLFFLFSACTVRTIRPEKCEIFAQRYQSQTINAKCQTRCWYFLNLLKPCQNVSLSQFLLFKMLYAIKAVWFERKKVQTQIRLLLEEQSDQGLHFLSFWTTYCFETVQFLRFQYIFQMSWLSKQYIFQMFQLLEHLRYTAM